MIKKGSCIPQSGISLFDLPNAIMDMELYDQKSSQNILEEIYNEFDSGKYRQQDLVDSIFMSIAAGILEIKFIKKITQKVGLNSQRLVHECHSFTYDSDFPINLGGLDAKNKFETQETNQLELQRQTFEEYAKEHRPGYIREIYQDTSKMNDYKDKKIKENVNRINMIDEYSKTWDMTGHISTADKRRNDPKHEHNAETDHIIPLEKQFECFKGNYALSDEDIKTIANDDSNLAVTKREINNQKRSCTNEEYVEGKGKNLSEDTKQNMIKMAQEAELKRDELANKAIIHNMLGQGKNIKVSDIYSKQLNNAGKQVGMAAIGEVILLIIKPLYYEIADIFIKGNVTDGTGHNSVTDAILFRLKRIQKYVLKKISSLKEIALNVWELLKTFLSSLIEGLINMFLGVFKQALKLVKQGILVGYQAYKILFGPDSHSTSQAEKGDAIVKLIGTTVLSFCSIGIETLLQKIGCPEILSAPVATIISGVASALFLYFLDKADLFSIKSEIRSKRVNEIFEKRIQEIEDARIKANTEILNVLKEQRMQMLSYSDTISKAIQKKDFNNVNKSIFEMAKIMNVNLPYQTVPECVTYLDEGGKNSF